MACFLSGIFQYDQSRKDLLHELEKKGGHLCKEHARLQHQIDHVTWHLEGCHRHRPCHGTTTEHCPSKKATGTCISYDPGSVHKPSVMVSFVYILFSADKCKLNLFSFFFQGNLKATSERLVRFAGF